MANDPLRPEIRLVRQRGPTPPHHLAGPRPNAFDRAFPHSQDPEPTSLGSDPRLRLPKYRAPQTIHSVIFQSHDAPIHCEQSRLAFFIFHLEPAQARDRRSLLC